MKLTGTIFLLLIISSCGNSLLQKERIEWTMPLVSENVPIYVEVIFEDIENKTFCLDWDHSLDSIHDKKGVFELHCFIRDSKGTIAKYKGSSTSFSHLYFSTTDTVVWVYFKRAIRLDLGDRLIPIKIEDYEPIYYEPIQVKIERFKTRHYLLEPDSAIVYLAYRNKAALNPDPMPRVGREFSHLWGLNYYYLNKDNGKIKQGKEWLNKIGSYNCAFGNFGIIDPLSSYTNTEGKTIKGSEIIAAKRISPETYDFGQFKSFEETAPY
ncbi:hypothetical protein GYB29_09920 [bacterium]|nr:hypothetical protein [bacterium]